MINQKFDKEERKKILIKKIEKRMNVNFNDDEEVKSIKKYKKILEYLKNLYIVKKCKESFEMFIPSETKNISSESVVVAIIFVIVSSIVIIVGNHYIKIFNEIYKLIITGSIIYFGIVFEGLGIAILCDYLYSKKKGKITRGITILVGILVFTILLPMLIPMLLLMTTSKRVKMDLLLDYFSEVMIAIMAGFIVGLISFYPIVKFVLFVIDLTMRALIIPTQLINLKGVIFIVFLLLLMIINFTAIYVIKIIFKIKERSDLYTKDVWKKRRNLLLLQFKLFKYCLIIFATFSLKILDFNALSTNYTAIAENNKKNNIEYETAQKKAEDAKNMGIYVEALFYSTGLFTLARTVSSVAGEQKNDLNNEKNKNDNSISL